MHSIAITTECVADLPRELLQQAGIELIYYDIETEEGIFRDTVEVDAENVMEYLYESRGKAKSIVSSVSDYKNFFLAKLEEYDEIVHISNSTKISFALSNAMQAREKLGKEGRNIYLIDSGHLSSGLGLMVLHAARLRDSGLAGREIVARMVNTSKYVSTSFMADSTEYLLENHRVNRFLMKLGAFFHVHPVIHMKDGQMVMKRFFMGNYDKSMRKYVSDALKNPNDIEQEFCILTYAGCSHELRKKIKEEIRVKVPFGEIWEQPASATVSCNCGPKTFGVIYYKKGIQ